MKVKYDQELMDVVSGRPMAVGPGVMLTVGKAIMRALNDAAIDPKNDKDGKDVRWDLMKKINEGKDSDLNKAEVALILSVVGRTYKPGVYGLLKDAVTRE